MTQPDQLVPTGSISATGLSAYAAKSQVDYQNEQHGKYVAAFGGAQTGFGNILHNIGQLIIGLGQAAIEGVVDFIHGIFTKVVGVFQGVFNAVKNFLGFGGDGDGSTQAEFEDATNHMVGDLSKRLGQTSPVKAHNVVGVLHPKQISLIHASAVTDQNTNLLLASFADPLSLDAAQNWSYDASEGNTAAGSAKVVADGIRNELVSNQIPVTGGQNMTASVFCKWSSLTYTGTKPISLGITEYFDGSEQGYAEVAAFTSPASSSSWTGLSGTYAVPTAYPVDEVRLTFRIDGNLTVGNVWWDDAAVYKTDLVQDSVVPGIGTTVDNITQSFFGLGGAGYKHVDSYDAMASQSSATTDNSSQIASLWAALSANPGASDDFERTASSSSLGSNWDEAYGSGNGHWGTDGHAAYWVPQAPNGNRESLCRWIGATGATSSTDYQTVSMVLGSAADVDGVSYLLGNATNDLIARCDSAKSNYIRFRVCGNGDWTLSKCISGTLTTMASGSASRAGSGAVLTLIAGDKVNTVPRYYTAKINGSTVASGVYSDTTSNYGASYRCWGLGGRAEGTIFFPQDKPGKINAWVAQDT